MSRRLKIIYILALFFIGCGSPEKIQEQKQEEITVIFDLESLYRKNIDEIRTVLGEPTDGDFIEPTKQQIEFGASDEWNNTFNKGEYELLITFNVANRNIIDFFISTGNPSGKTKNTKKLEQILGIQNSTNYTVESVKSFKSPSYYTGIKVIPKK